MTAHDTVVGPRILRGHANGHPYAALVADGEPRRERERALRDLEAALPSPEAFVEAGGEVTGLATTPDFHAGRPVPVGVALSTRGVVLPHVVGNDVGCGMRLLVLKGVTVEEVLAHAPALARHIRHMLFQGGRNIALTGTSRRALLCAGLPGFLDDLGQERRGLLGRLDITDAWSDLDRTCDGGHFASVGIHPSFESYATLGARPSWDAHAGSLGGGNHFLEIGYVERVEDGAFAHAARLREGDVTLCVHSGSLDFGQAVAASARDACRARPGDGRILPFKTADADRYLTGLSNAGHFAMGNRLLLGLIGAEAIRRATGREPAAQLVYDAAHNMAWVGPNDTEVLHRKGACPARGPDTMQGTPYAWLGEPVILPGSMGDATWLLRGAGCKETLASSAHGAGRRLSRRQARHSSELPGTLRTVAPVDFVDPSLRSRPDILSEAQARLREEAPSAYRDVEDVLQPMQAANVAHRVARIAPLMTAKG